MASPPLSARTATRIKDGVITGCGPRDICVCLTTAGWAMCASGGERFLSRHLLRSSCLTREPDCPPCHLVDYSGTARGIHVVHIEGEEIQTVHSLAKSPYSVLVLLNPTVTWRSASPPSYRRAVRLDHISHSPERGRIITHHSLGSIFNVEMNLANRPVRKSWHSCPVHPISWDRLR